MKERSDRISFPIERHQNSVSSWACEVRYGVDPWVLIGLNAPLLPLESPRSLRKRTTDRMREYVDRHRTE